MSLSIGVVAKRSNVAVSALHFYERKGLISSYRNAGNQRRFDRSVLRRLAIIKAAQQIGMSLQEITDALAHLPKNVAPSQADWQQLASTWQNQLQDKIARLKHLERNLGSCIGCGCLSLEKCALYNPDDAFNKYRPGESVLSEPKLTISNVIK
ncbi:redox-sensitive transcriptional activator SoxR [Salinibius halmophilus]|uniref:redox-sensitive transcriptional activator SoxR n=1 Tax=Salinibius halmophilus TaxID=1853216 RepID=UPI000E67106A|nr:redox-sensitive transcriptional activator SoxR [Salinibius halmophilus]